MGSHHLVPRVYAIKNGSIPSACATQFSEFVSLRALFNSRCPYRKTNSKCLTSTAALLEMARLLQTHQGGH